MASSTSIKVDRLTLIAALEKSRDEKQAAYDAAVKAYPALKAKFDKDIEAFKKLAIKNAVNGEVNIHVDGNGEISFSIEGDLPKGHTYPVEPADPSVEGGSWDYQTRRFVTTGGTVDIANIDKALKVLRLSTDATVPASYYQSVIDYI